MNLTYDPAGGEAFWQAVGQLPGFPHGERIRLGQMIFESGGLFRLPELLAETGASRSTPLLVVMDPTEMMRGEDSLKSLLLETLRIAGFVLQPLVLAPSADGQVHTSLEQINHVKSRLQPGMAALSVGSGVVTDVTKHACFLFEQQSGYPIPFIVYQTANSVSAYTSNMAPVFIEGVKRTLPSRYPDALLCDLETLRDAPYEMTVAGVGDLLAASVSLPDWYLAHRLGMDDSYCDLPSSLVGNLDAIMLAHATSIRQRTLGGMSLLAKLISLGGLAMSLVGASTPMSGYEHLISHALDLQNEMNGRHLAQHGSQVALAALLASRAYQVFLDDFNPGVVDPGRPFQPEQETRKRVLAAFAAIDPSGAAGGECWADYRLKLERWHGQREALRIFLDDWQQVRATLRRLAWLPQRLREVLDAVGASLRFSELNPPAGEAEVRFAFFNAPLMRRRITLGDALIFFGVDRQRIWQSIQTAGWI